MESVESEVGKRLFRDLGAGTSIQPRLTDPLVANANLRFVNHQRAPKLERFRALLMDQSV